MRVRSNEQAARDHRAGVGALCFMVKVKRHLESGVD
jgi:hypothetical protein